MYRLDKAGNFIEFKNGKSIKPGGDGAYPVYGANGIIGMSDEYWEENSIIVGRVGAYCGAVQYCRGRYWASDNTIVACPKDRNTNVRFLYYQLKNANLNRWAGGAAQPLMTQTVIKQIDLPYPSLMTQRKVASILSAYDDLIENNTRRIQILEEMCQRIYREWFVDFRFPGHERGKLIDGPICRIPEGWDIVEVGKRFKTVLGGTPSRVKEEYWSDGNIPWINSGKVNEIRIIDESEFITELGLRKSSTKMMPKRTTVIAITGATLGQVSLLEIEVCANQSVVGIWDEEHIYDEYLYFKFCEIIESVILKAGGGAQQHINKEIVNSETIVIPPKPVINKFNEHVRPMCDLIRNLLIKNKVLMRKRDILLPKLISGEIDVSEIDIAIQEQENGA